MNNVIRAGVSNVTIDNLEIKNQGISTSTVGGATAAINFIGNGDWSAIVENCFIHDFITNSQLTSSWVPDYSAGGVYNVGLLLNTIIDDTGGYGFNSSGTKIAGGTLGGACENCGEVSNSKFVKTMAACFTVPNCHDSEFTGITQTVLDAANPSGYAPLGSARPHTQVIENDFNGQSTIHNVYNNFIHDNTNVGVTIYECDGTNIYNNVMFNNGGNPNILLSACSSLGSSAVANVYNNTVDCSNGSPCLGTDSKGTLPGTVNLKNNLWITNGTAVNYSSTVVTLVSGNNYTMPSSEANRYGFTSSQKYFPGSADPNVVGKGVDLMHSLASSLLSVLTPLAYDAEGAPWFGGSPLPRTSTWDLGAYVLGAQSTSTVPSAPRPAAPSTLVVVVQ